MTSNAHKQRRNAETREMSAARKSAGLTYACGKLSPEEVSARLAEIPPDMRNLTQRICGDPLPGRDALSRRQQK